MRVDLTPRIGSKVMAGLRGKASSTAKVESKRMAELIEKAGPRGTVDQTEMVDPKPKVGWKVMVGLSGKDDLKVMADQRLRDGSKVVMAGLRVMGKHP